MRVPSPGGFDMIRARWRSIAVCCTSFLIAVTASRAAAAQGTINGRITNEAGQPLADARVIVIGGTAAATTAEDGKYSLRNVPAGTFDIQALRVGFQSQKKSVTVTVGVAATADFSMKQAIVQLDEVVTTATGQQRKIELGNSIQTLGDVGKNVET